ncbi:hypothetical protein PV08_09140 [Exophiala spinifera]|uniref:Fungal STAND N-terminal Goodbye domain-containing protein n=1 Tax=Exophiala spinifera TaxID=91928 RepID=A0A0D1ZFV2_9EURO|nr:uncharacterized protein PV08_09140 [Exophiala spinifera]KIW11867.1 hypothetical protein PV08_09140 [Exophiala spinifera]
MAETSLTELWEKAIREYVDEYEKSTDQHLTESDLQGVPVNLQHTNGQSLETFLAALQVNKEQLSDLRNKKRKVVTAFRKCILPLHFILDAADNCIKSTPVAPISVLFFAVQHILSTCERVSKSFDEVEEVFQRVAAVTCCLGGYNDSSLVGSHQTVVVEVLSCLLKIVGAVQSKLATASRLREFRKSLFKNDETISQGLAELDRRVQDELSYVVRLNFAKTQKMSETTLSIHKEVLEIRQELLRSRADGEVLDVKTDLVEKLRNESWEALRNHHRMTADAIATTTGIWIQTDAMFAAWENGQGPLLWIFGRPGVGKTALAAATVEALKSKYSKYRGNHSVRATGYIYFREGQPKLQNLSNLFLAVAGQIAKQDQRFHQHVTQAIRTYPDILGQTASAESLWDRLFLSFDPPLEDHEEAGGLLYIIIDGLDEAKDESKRALLTCLRRLLASQPTGQTSHERVSIQVAVFARREIRKLLEIQGSVFEGNEKIINITEGQTKHDIRVYVRHQTKHIAAVRMIRKMAPEKSQAFESFIEHSIVTRSEGMFLWAKLVIDRIRDSPSTESVQHALYDAPSGLLDMIHLVFLRLNHEEEDRTRYLADLLAWVLCCRRPLTIAELHVCLIETVGESFITISDDLTERYSSLFDVVQRPSSDDTSRTATSTQVSKEESEDDLELSDSDDGAPATGYASVEPSWKQFSLKRVSVQANNGIFDEWHRSTVTFAHARIRDYLVQEGNPRTRKWDDCRVVPEIDQFKMQMVQTLLDLAMKPITQKYGVHLLKEYAAENCISHLLEIDLVGMPPSLCGRVGSRLASLCYDGKLFYNIQDGQWQTTIDTWLLDTRKTNVVRSLIAKGIDYLDTDYAEIRPWALQAVKSARVLLEPLMKECARLWLAKRAWDDMDWFNKCEGETWVLLAYEFLTQNGENVGPFSVLKGTRRVGRITRELIDQVAKSQNLEQDEYWFTGIAWTTMQGEDARHSRKAIEYFEKAVSLADDRTRRLYGVAKPVAWVAYEGLSRCYGDNLLQSQPALEAMRNAIEALPPFCLKYGVDYYFKARAAYWQLKLDRDYQVASRIGREAYERSQDYMFGTKSPSDHVIMDSVKVYIEILSWMQDFDSISTVIRDLSTRQTLLPGCSLLNCFLRYNKFTDHEFRRLTNFIAMVLYQRRDPELENLLQDNFKKVAYVDTSGKPFWNDLRLAIRSANFLLRHFKDVNSATKIHKSILSAIDSNDETYRQRMRPIRDQAAAFLSFRHFNEAIDAKVAKKGLRAQAIDNLRHLAMNETRQYRASYSALLYGVWLRDHQPKSKRPEPKPPKPWRPAFEPSVTEAINKLYDDDTWNDDDAYTQLGEALMMANDLDNAATAFGIALMQALEPVVPHQGTGFDSIPENAEELAYLKCAISSQIRRCDGICDPSKDDFKELWCCRFCEKTWLCGDCVLLLKKQDNEADRYVVCSSDHEHLQAYPLSERAKDIVNALRHNDSSKHHQWLQTLLGDWKTN